MFIRGKMNRTFRGKQLQEIRMFVSNVLFSSLAVAKLSKAETFHNTTFSMR